MTYTIAGTYTTLVTLGAAIDNPTTITKAGRLTDGLQVSYQGLTVVNAGSIAGNGYGVVLFAGGSVTNQGGGSISGGRDGVCGENGAVTVVNAGSIVGSNEGVFLLSGGSVTNQSGGSITGRFIGINGYGGVTVVDAGTIGGASYAVLFGAGFANRLVLDPNAVFYGTVTGGNTIGAAQVSTLELAAAGSAGTLSGLGTQFVDFAQVTVDAGSQWTLAGANALAPGDHLTDAGTLTNAGTLDGAGVLTGVLTLVPGGVLSNASTGTIAAGAGSAVRGAAGGAATVVNAGMIAGDGADGQGIYLAGGGSVTNLGGEAISGDRYGIYGKGATVTVVNAGSIAGSGPNAYGAGIDLAAGGGITNAGGGSIGGYRGISGQGGGVTVVNAGTIAGSNEGVALSAGGNITNQNGGSITGGFVAIGGAGVAVTVVNAGRISGSSQGVVLFAGGNVTNQSGGSITGQDGIFSTGGAVTVVNAGGIAGSSIGVYLRAGGSVTNQSGGSITRGFVGISGAGAAMTVVNAGTIAGAGYAVLFAAGYANRLVIDPNAVFSGTVTGGNAIGAAQVSTLELASGASAGTLSGLGTQFVDFAQVTIDSGAQWTLAGGNTLAKGDTIANAGTLTLSDATLSGAAALVNNGAIVLDPSSMTIASLTGSGSVTIEAGSTLDVTGVIASTETIVFAGPGALLQLGTPDSAAGAVAGFAAGDTIDLAGIAPASVSDTGGTVSFPGGSFPLTAAIPLVIEPDGNGGTDIACFAQGTRIATQDGPVTVEALRPGDRVLTASGTVRPVRWIGVRSIDLARHPAPAQVRPIRIAAGAFAPGMPSGPLRLSPDHAVLLHGLLIPIKLLRNDASITRETGCRAVTYHHVELDAHDVLLAEGLAAESYLDTGNRAMFANAGLPVVLHPDLTSGQARRERESCAPFADQPEVVEPIWRTLAARAAQMGLAAPPMPETTDDPALHLMVDGRRCEPASIAQGRYTFVVAGHASAVRLVSRHAERPDTAPWVADGRRLGVQLRAMTIRRGGVVAPVPLDHPLLAEGWWAPEWHAATTLRRWTKGDAAVPLMDAGPGPLVLEVEVAATVPYSRPSAAKEAGARRVASMAV